MLVILLTQTHPVQSFTKLFDTCIKFRQTKTVQYIDFFPILDPKIGIGRLVLQESNFDHKQHCNNYDTVWPVVELGFMLPCISICLVCEMKYIISSLLRPKLILRVFWQKEQRLVVKSAYHSNITNIAI